MTQNVLFDLDAQYFICKQSAQLTEDQKLSQGLSITPFGWYWSYKKRFLLSV